MHFVSRSVLATVALFAASPAFAQSKEDVASKISSALPSTNRGQITAQSLRDVMNTLNGARGQPNGIAELGPDGRLLPTQGQSSFTDGNFLGSVNAPLAAFNALQMKAAIPPVDTSLAGTANPNAVMIANGNMVSFCPFLSCIKGPLNGTTDARYFDHQRASHLISAVTQVDGQAEEQALATIMTVNKGFQKKWAPNTAFALGDNISFAADTTPAGNAVWRVIQAGTTGASNALPTNRPACSTQAPAPCPEFTVTDGTVKWLWINDQRITGKLGHYNEVTVLPGGGTAWAGVDNLHLTSGVVPSFYTAREIDLTNDSGSDCAVGASNCNGLAIYLQGANTSTAFLAMSSANTGKHAAAYGILIGGAKSASAHDISVQSSAAVGLDFGSFGGSSHSTATIRDLSTSPIGYQSLGTHSTAAFYDGSVSGSAISLNGNYTAAIDTNGASAAYAFTRKAGQRTCLNGLDNCLVYGGGATQLQKGGSSVFSISDNGDLVSAGRIGSGGAPVTVANCGTGPALRAGSNDTFGTVTTGTGGTQCTINFSAVRSAAAFCTLSANNGVPATLVATSTTALTWNYSGAGNYGFTYACFGT